MSDHKVKSLESDANCEYETTTKNSLGNTPLIMACMESNLHIAELLLKAGVGIEDRNVEDKTALAIACEMTDIPMIKLLIEYGADVNAIVSNMSISIISNMIDMQEEIKIDTTKFLEILKYFVEHGYELDNKKSLEPELISAVWYEAFDVIEYLVGKGVNLNRVCEISEKNVFDVIKCKKCEKTKQKLLNLLQSKQ